MNGAIASDLANAAQALEILHLASTREFGLRVRVIARPRADGLPSPTPSWRGRQILWRFRQEDNNPLLRQLQIRLSPNDPDNEIWIIKFDRELTSGPEGREIDWTENR